MPIENRNLNQGTKLTGRYHKQSYSCEVVENAEGKLMYRLQDGREFKSPSAAGMAITGHACDGWVFWSVQTEETLPPPECRESGKLLLRQRPNRKWNLRPNLRRLLPRPTPRRQGYFWCRIRRVCRKGKIRWFCRDCGKSFIASAVEVPGVCPNHQAS